MSNCVFNLTGVPVRFWLSGLVLVLPSVFYSSVTSDCIYLFCSFPFVLLIFSILSVVCFFSSSLLLLLISSLLPFFFLIVSSLLLFYCLSAVLPIVFLLMLLLLTKRIFVVSKQGSRWRIKLTGCPSGFIYNFGFTNTESENTFCGMNVGEV